MCTNAQNSFVHVMCYVCLTVKNGLVSKLAIGPIVNKCIEQILNRVPTAILLSLSAYMYLYHLLDLFLLPYLVVVCFCCLFLNLMG